MTIVFFFNDTATTEIYTLSLHDALPIFARCGRTRPKRRSPPCSTAGHRTQRPAASSSLRTSRLTRSASRAAPRSEEHTSELQSRQYLVCRLLLEKKN